MSLSKLTTFVQIHFEEFFFFLLLALAFSVPTSRLLTSMSEFGLFFLFLIDCRYRLKIKRFIQNRTAVLLSFLYLMLLLGLIFTSDFQSAFKDLRIQLPLFLLPFLFSGAKALNKKRALWVLMAFILGVLYVGIFSSVESWFSHQDLKSILSDRFIKHMRYSLEINLALFSLLLMVFTEYKKRGIQIMFLIIALFFAFFIFRMGALFAYVLFFILLLFLGLYALFHTKKWRFLIALMAFVSIFLTVSYLIYPLAKNYFQEKVPLNIQTLDKVSLNGNPYYFNKDYSLENGKLIYVYVCEKELRAAWNHHSTISYDGLDKKGQELKATLIRYMTSLDLRKDSLGFSRLSKADIQHIENGIANIQYTTKNAFEVRLMQFAFEWEQLQNKPNPSGYSFGQRREYWKVAFYQIKKAWFLGYGTGDIDAVMQQGYKETHSLLNSKFWFRPHNQFLSIELRYGIWGFFLFVFTLFYPPLFQKAFKNPYYLLFFISVFTSFLVEDVFDTQSGVSYFAFFNTFFLLLWPKAESLKE
jgi:hypothetical protein